MYSQEEIKNAKKLIVEQIAIGKSLNELVKTKKIPSYPTIYNWLNKTHDKYDEEFFNNYARAREEQADFYADEIVKIADETKDPAKARVQIDARKWVASKLKPKKYGDRLSLDHSGELQLRKDVSDLFPPELDDE